MSRKNIPDSTKVPDDMLALQRKRIAANRPEMDKLLDDIGNGATWKALAKAYKEGLVGMTRSYKTLAITVHDNQLHVPQLSVCPDPLCKVNNEQVNAGIGLIARATELEPKEEVKP